MKPIISICLSSYRPGGCLRFYNSIGKTDIPFEMIAVGPNPPTRILPPDNFHHIISHVKPPQCFEIACRKANGDYILHVADDWQFVTEYPLERLLEFKKLEPNFKTILSCSLKINGIDQSPACHYTVPGDGSSMISAGTFISSEFVRYLGGIDRRFIAAFWDIDLIYRAHEAGGRVILTDVWVNEESTPAQGSARCAPFWAQDRRLLNQLWGLEYPLPHHIDLKRRSPVQQYSSYRLHSASQGPRGRWVGPNPRLEHLTDALKSTVRQLFR